MATEHEMQDVLEMLTGVREDKARMRLLKAWLTDHKLSSQQVRPLLDTFFGLGDVKVEAAVAMYARVVDQENFKDTVLPTSFKYEEERAAVRSKLGL